MTPCWATTLAFLQGLHFAHTFLLLPRAAFIGPPDSGPMIERPGPGPWLGRPEPGQVPGLGPLRYQPLPSYRNLFTNLSPMADAIPLREANPLAAAKKVESKKTVDIYANAVKLAAQLRREKLDLERENERIKHAIGELKTHRQEELSIAEAALQLDLAELKAEHEKNKESYENARQLAIRLIAEKEVLEKENKALNKSLEYLKAAIAAKDAPTPAPELLDFVDITATDASVTATNKTSGGLNIGVHVEPVQKSV